MSTSVNSVVDLAPTTAGLGGLNSEIAAFVDMYRECRLDKCKFDFDAPSAISGTTQVPPRVFAVVQGGAAAPTWSTIETPLMSALVSGSSYQSAADYVPNTPQVGHLKFRGRDLVVLNEASGPGTDGWLATQGDGSTTSFGTIYMIQYTAGTAVTYNMAIRYSITLSFRVLVDPAQISSPRLMARLRRELELLKNKEQKTTYPTDGSTVGVTPKVAPVNSGSSLVETAPSKPVAVELTGNSGTTAAAWQEKPLGEYENPVIGSNEDLIAYRAFLDLRRRKG